MVTFCRDMQVSPLVESADWLEWELLVMGLKGMGKGKDWRFGLQTLAIRLIQRASRLAARIIITSTNEAAQASSFWAS